MAKIKRLALIGTGRWGSLIKKTLITISDCELAFEGAREWKILLTRNDIDGVIIATPPATHAEIALPFIDLKIPVFIEKPMTLSVEEAKKIEMAAKKSNSLVMVGHIHLYNPAFNAARDLVQECGNIHLLVGEGSSKNALRIDCSVIWDWSPHDLAMMIAILGEIPNEVSAWGMAALRPGTTFWDVVQMRLSFPSGVTGLISSSCLLPERRRRLTIIGEKKSIIFDDIPTENKVTLYEGTAISHPSYDSQSPLGCELKEFLSIIESGTQSKSDAVFGRYIIEILDAAERSIELNGATVTIP